MTQHYTDGKTIRISAFFQIIVKDFQGVKTLKESKTPQKYLNKKDNFWLKMHSREVTTWPTYRKLKRSTYVKKCKSIPTMFTSNYNPLQTTQWRSKPCYGISVSLCNQLMYLYLFLPPLPHISYHSPQPLLAIVNNAFCGQKTQMQKISFSTRTKAGLEYILTENIYEISLCWEESLCYVFPYDYPGGLDATDAWTTRRKLLKSFS